MGQDEVYLQVIATSGEGIERKNAAKVLKLLKKGKHWVLVTLLVANVITNETLPIVLDRSIGGGYVAAIVSTLLVSKSLTLCPQTFACVLLTASVPSHFWRNRSAVDLCALRPRHWRMDVQFRSPLDVDFRARDLADRKSS